MKYQWIIYLILIVKFQVGISQEIKKTANNMKSITIYEESYIDKLSSIDSISELFIIVPKIKKQISIDLISPELLNSLSINEFEHYIFIDSFPNITHLGIEGKFNEKNSIMFNPLNIRSISIFNFINDDYSFLERLVNIDTIFVGYFKDQDAVLNSIKNANSLKYLYLYSDCKKGILSEKITSFRMLKTLASNILFSYKNIEILNYSNSILQVIFLNQKINKIPLNFKNIKTEVEIIFKSCKITQEMKEQILIEHKNVKFIY